MSPCLPRKSFHHTALLRVGQYGNATYKGIIGEAIPLYAGAYPASASGILYSQVAGNKGEL